MKVHEIMTNEVKACRPDDTLDVAARIMWEQDCGCVPVVEADSGRVVGMITDRDICMAAFLRGQPPQALAVETVMAKRVSSCNSHDTLGNAEQIMRAAHIRRLPVTDEQGRLAGILSLNDIVLATKRPERRGQIGADEVADTLVAVSEHRRAADVADQRH